FLFINLLRAAENALIIEIVVSAAEEAEEFVEAALLRMELWLGAQMPLADKSRGVAGGFEAGGDRRFGEREAAAGGTGVEFVAKSCLIAAGHESSPRWRAIGAGDIAIGAADAGLC